jgi:hypothetical protein
MVPMPEPITVWMVPLRKGVPPREVEGTLSMDDHALTFEATKTGQHVSLPFGEIVRTKRVRISPIMIIRASIEEEPVEIAFYFAPPPPLGPMDPTNITATSTSPFGGLKGTGKHRQRRQNTTYLANTAGTLTPLVKVWTTAVKERTRVAKQP